MTRIAFDHYDTAAEAASAVEALRLVGLNPGDLATAWNEADAGVERPGEPGPNAAPLRPGHGVWLQGIGRLHLTGWLSQAATPGSSRSDPMELDALFSALALSPDDRDHLCRTLASGGGIVAIRAADSGP